MNSTPIVCTPDSIPPERRAEHRKRFADVVLAKPLHSQTDAAGFVLVYRADDFLELAKWVDLERLCCAFARFDLRADANGVELRIAGPEGTVDYLVSLLSGY